MGMDETVSIEKFIGGFSLIYRFYGIVKRIGDFANMGTVSKMYQQLD